MTKEEAKSRVKSDIYQYADFSDNPNEDEFWQALDMLLEQEPCEDCCNGDQEEKAKLCQKSYLAGMEHRQAPCEDAISRQAVLDMMQMRMGGKELYKAVYDLPPVTPQPKTGRWITVNKGLIVTLYKCSECGRTVKDDTGYDVTKDYPYCHCGAKMQEVKNEEEE